MIKWVVELVNASDGINGNMHTINSLCLAKLAIWAILFGEYSNILWLLRENFITPFYSGIYGHLVSHAYHYLTRSGIHLELGTYIRTTEPSQWANNTYIWSMDFSCLSISPLCASYVSLFYSPLHHVCMVIQEFSVFGQIMLWLKC